VKVAGGLVRLDGAVRPSVFSGGNVIGVSPDDVRF
jgi:hypothetical protein